MRQNAPEREPAPGVARRPLPPTARNRAQRALGIVMAAGLLSAVLLWLAGRRLDAIIAASIAVIASLVFVRRTGSDPGKRSKGHSTVNKWWQFRFFGFGQESPSDDDQQHQHQHQPQPPQPQAIAPVSLRPEYQPGSQGHPFAPRPSEQIPPPRPKEQHHAHRWRGGQQPASPASAGPPAWTDQGTRLPDPRVFVAPSTPGQSPWHLPPGAAPSGLAADGLRLGDLEARAASVVGAGHRCQEPATPRQDAYGLARTNDGQYLVIAIADGVSQSKHADLAARVAVAAATRELARMLEFGGIGAIDQGLLYKKVTGEIVGTGRNRGIDDADVCAILITAVIPSTPNAGGTRPLWVSWIGDVSLWISRGGELRRMTGQGKSGFDRNALHAVLPFNPDQGEQLSFELQPDDRVVLMTDGVSDTLDSVDGTLDYFARQWAGPPPHPAAFLHSLCYDGPGQMDDRTAVVVWCSTASQGGQRAPGERR